MTMSPPATVKLSEMKKDMEEFAILAAQEGIERFHSEKEIASYVKREFDRKFGTTWHCFVGRNFGSYVTHEAMHYIFFYVGQMGVMLFKSG